MFRPSTLVCIIYQAGASKLLIMGSADEHPEAEVLGVDPSPIQPGMYALLRKRNDSLITEHRQSRVPPNCKFEVDDLAALLSERESSSPTICRTDLRADDKFLQTQGDDSGSKL